MYLPILSGSISTSQVISFSTVCHSNTHRGAHTAPTPSTADTHLYSRRVVQLHLRQGRLDIVTEHAHILESLLAPVRYVGGELCLGNRRPSGTTSRGL